MEQSAEKKLLAGIFGAEFQQDPETWRPIRWFEKTYEVSNQLRVRRVRGTDGARRYRYLKPGRTHGFSHVSLYRNNVQSSRQVYQLVIEAFTHDTNFGERTR